MIYNSTLRVTGLFFATLAMVLMLSATYSDARHPQGKRHFKAKKLRKGNIVRVLPRGHSAIKFGNVRYFFNNGLFYQSARAGYLLVAAPIGIVVAGLPAARTIIIVGGRPYYHFGGVFYQKVPAGFIVVKRPPGIVVP